MAQQISLQNQQSRSGESDLEDESEEIIEKVDIKLTTLIKFLLSLIFIIFIIVLVLKPEIIFDNLKRYANAEYGSQKVIYQEDLAENEIVYQQGQMKISKQALYFLLKDAIQKDYINRIEFAENKVIFMADISKNDVPLWLILSLKVENDKDLQIDKVGFGRFEFPDFIKDKVLQKIIDVGMDLEKTALSSLVLSRLFTPDELSAISIKKIEVREEYIIFDIDIEEDILKDSQELFKMEILKFRDSLNK